MKRFRALIFDVDGTLAETEEMHRRAFNETFAYFGAGLGVEHLSLRDSSTRYGRQGENSPVYPSYLMSARHLRP